MTDYPTLDVIVPGPCEPKGRPRVRRRGQHVRLYTPKVTEDYEERVAAYARLAAAELGGWVVGRRVPLRLEVEVVCRRPGRLWRKVDDNGERAPVTVRPDLDNYVKSILDGLQRAELFADDAQVVELSARKVYGRILDRENKGQEGPFARVRLSVVACL
jgi:Holliday junction resolvase RusA-like endonuclease